MNIVIPIAVAPLRYAQARPARAEPLVPSAALPPLPLSGVAAVRMSEVERERNGVEGPESWIRSCLIFYAFLRSLHFAAAFAFASVGMTE
jgi:hypothetical protein